MMPEPISKPTEVFLPPNSPKRAISAYGLKRSEEHTSELQSPCNLVCRLLLEKKQIRRVPERTADCIAHDSRDILVRLLAHHRSVACEHVPRFDVLLGVVRGAVAVVQYRRHQP